MSDQRWGLYIDIEGFGAKYDQSAEALIPLRALMSGIYSIGTKVYDYTDDVNRLFAHQFGDGFIIVSCFHEDSLDRATTIAIALMRYVLSSGGIAKASIAEGDFSDIKNCYPDYIVKNEKDGALCLGAGVMTIIPVMGTALINAIGIDKRSPSGSLLTIHKDNSSRISSVFTVKKIENDLLSINWLKGEPPSVSALVSKAGFKQYSEKERIEMMRKYIDNNKLSPAWIRTTCHELGLSF